ncbi:acyltransferase [Lacihabitans sp. LS3-19]|uniref:acyltransferase family protein n=1 Tax=Lacihabitans sp. LS3-19 TaxID=2487335 RepID=UPI0020CB7B8C|nr:acyltransferase [Lacihabitans sp. LS3-19]MCP9766685.1 acyltransferase [Lacihabitans sp. LS3-19]
MKDKNNFDFLRLVFSIFIIIGHSYAISGSSERDIIFRITNEQLLLQDIALTGFFLASGFFIFPSLQRSKSISTYLIKRGLRIFPGIVFMTLIICLLGVFVYKGSSFYYFTHWPVYKYFIRAPFLFLSNTTFYDLFATNPLPQINGSLWTIPYEFALYIFIILLFVFKNNISLSKGVLFFLSIGLICYNIYFYKDQPNYYFFISGEYLLYFGCFFVIGAWASTIKDFIFENKGIILSLGLIICFSSIWLNNFRSFNYIIIPMVILPLGLFQTPFIKNIGENIGDLSYGIYIYGWPVQQTLFHFFNLEPIRLMIFASIISIFLGYISWHLIEKRALAFKSRI